MAWQQTRGQRGFVRQDHPSEDLFWGTASLAGATYWLHIDANGLATHVNNVTGTKYFVLFNRRRRTPEDTPSPDIGSMDAFPDTWYPWSSGCQDFVHEGILLTPKSWL
jgi:hypothetical protein